MSVLVDALQPYFIPGLNNVLGRAVAPTLSDLVGRQGRIGYDLDFDDANNTIRTDFRDVAIVVASMASDISRFASACFQSVKNIEQEFVEKNSMPWAFIKAYYAAFYAGHAVIRILGSACSYFDREHVSTITKIGTALGREPNFKIKSSAYHCVMKENTAVLESTSLRDGAGGAHEAFWNVLGLRMKTIGEDVLLGPLGAADAALAYAKIDAFQKQLRAFGAPSHGWLSTLRNEIQYRQGMGLWIPNEKRRKDMESYSRLFEQHKKDPVHIDVEERHDRKAEMFILTCAFLVALCRELLVRLTERSDHGSRCFARVGPLSILSSKSTLLKR